MQVNIIVNGGENETYTTTWTFWQTLDNKTGNLVVRRRRASCEVDGAQMSKVCIIQTHVTLLWPQPSKRP